MKMTTTCAEGLTANGWHHRGQFHEEDAAIAYRLRLNRLGETTHLHNCPQDHGRPDGAWAVWSKEPKP